MDPALFAGEKPITPIMASGECMRKLDSEDNGMCQDMIPMINIDATSAVKPSTQTMKGILYRG